MIPALIAGLPGWTKYAAIAVAVFLVIAGSARVGYNYRDAQCKEAELARQLATERENMRILEESNQVAEGLRIRAERRAAELEAASRRRSNVTWECGDVQIPQEVLHDIR